MCCFGSSHAASTDIWLITQRLSRDGHSPDLRDEDWRSDHGLGPGSPEARARHRLSDLALPGLNHRGRTPDDQATHAVTAHKGAGHCLVWAYRTAPDATTWWLAQPHSLWTILPLLNLRL